MKFIWLILLTVISSTSFSQVVLKIKEAQKYNLNIAELDSTYMSGFHADTFKIN